MDISSIIIDCNDEIIFEFMSDIKNINSWSFGIKWDIINSNNKIIKGVSNYNKSISYLKIIKNHTIKKIDYWIGDDDKNLIPRIYVRVESLNNTKSKLSMVSFQTDDMDSDRWDKLIELHKLELLKIKELLSKK